MKKKLLFITPHLSTGGMPQFVLKQIETMREEYDIYVAEWEDVTGGVYVVQRKAIESMLGENFYSIGQDKSDILRVISDIDPDIVHFHKIPETFASSGILDRIYSDERRYYIVVTTHSSLTDPSSIRYTADRFVLVSEWSKRAFKRFFKVEVDCEVWDYLIE